MDVFCYAPAGFDGHIVHVEVDIRRGIPGLEIVGLPDNAVRESRERVRVATTNSGYKFPRDRILVNLAPADVRKEGSSFDLPIAIAILAAAGNIAGQRANRILAVGELQLSGEVRGVRGVLAAVSAGLDHEIDDFVVPEVNVAEAEALGAGHIIGVGTLRQCVETLCGALRRVACERGAWNDPSDRTKKETEVGVENEAIDRNSSVLDFRDLRGQNPLKRALVIAAAGRHHVMAFGPPGSGKTMAAQRLPSILPFLRKEESIELTRIHSLAGLLGANEGLIKRPSLRIPHHSATPEGIIGGGKSIRPGEISLAHHGILLLDEAPEFKKNLLQCLREPIESGRVDLARAGSVYWFPARFQLVLTANPCPCGNLGRDNGVCICTRFEVQKYWKRLGGALLDRIDIRVPVKPVSSEDLLDPISLSSEQMRGDVCRAREVQLKRSGDGVKGYNADMNTGDIARFCGLDRQCAGKLSEIVRKMSLSSRACHSILKVARTIADIEKSDCILKDHLYEAVGLRRYGDTNFFWN